ncbi:uncharacterized protein (TIGR02453 family) [Algoriphagus sp. 4150]|uniref:DUF2461 domain-containing protein n=1 Tax=Algoriphagus sp. 4150 TaxID=2817756 RepID=UPI00285CB888|nr:DUF2461 domain-containing protein [Algoriphagus sp. 4150]MDR7132029.1 uncharacterized protein (TIGR02453 family) [Algoriphagus sp. 4150]
MRPYLPFLTALAEHNSKEWMDANKKWYLETRAEFLEDVAVLLKGIGEWEPELLVFKAKDCVFRQNRDIRFSANKMPYKNNFGVYFSPKGKKSEGPGYYLQIQPDNSFLAGGIWMPMAETLKKIRREIDYSGAELAKIESNPEFKALFGQIDGERLKTSPRDYEADHEFIDYLRLKSFTVSSKISDRDIESGSFINIALEGFRKMIPLQQFLAQAIEDVEDGSGLL